MPDKGDFGSSESHATLPGGERVLIRRARPEDVALYPDFLADVSAEDLRLRFFARIAELSADEIDWLSHLNHQHDMAFIARIARKVTVLHEGSVLAEGPLDAVQSDERVVEVYLGR